MMRRVLGVVIAVVALGGTWLVTAPVDAVPATGSQPRLNQMQVIGMHNAYHVEPPPDLLAVLIGLTPSAIELAYTHPPLDEQFANERVRQIELDIHPDPDGNLFRPLGTKGFKVFHMEQVDEGSTCLTLVDCLQVVKGWSDAHPAHMPIGIQLEIKDVGDIPGPPDPPPMTPALYDALDAEIRSVFPPEKLLTPDDVRGARPTLEEAVLNDGWPRIDDIRGQMMFVLDNKRDDYIVGHPTLEGRVAFTPSEPGQPDAAFLKMNDPTGTNQAVIASMVEAGYIVRTRADNPVTTPQSGDTTQRDAALASGAQWVSTDYPIPGLATRWGSDYYASIPGGTPARCNPVNAPPGCVNSDVEDLPPDPGPGQATTTTTTVAPPPAVATATPHFTG